VSRPEEMLGWYHFNTMSFIFKLSRSLEWNKHGASYGTNNIAELYAIAIGVQLVNDILHNNPNHTLNWLMHLVQ
jgi:hypothetical protein